MFDLELWLPVGNLSCLISFYLVFGRCNSTSTHLQWSLLAHASNSLETSDSMMTHREHWGTSSWRLGSRESVQRSRSEETWGRGDRGLRWASQRHTWEVHLSWALGYGILSFNISQCINIGISRWNSSFCGRHDDTRGEICVPSANNSWLCRNATTDGKLSALPNHQPASVRSHWTGGNCLPLAACDTHTVRWRELEERLTVLRHAFQEHMQSICNDFKLFDYSN